ncbi:GCN5-related N-acetyltransferase [Kribbella flavida DSM 17836]|uniref:GCN5-related N-acetyltransferase n=1 Tax=Kribbella flavida (strain DSM 17836 / JCM 10339 / NBRC 14399) TaxID=479435 RepID=D2PN50_KRIFD|nr:GNAT family N-acetyltransferase [Kribbella flavida]ADB34534.1 GCN5-related N-acetyltransferase [Kribbella flavida DSM 17836]
MSGLSARDIGHRVVVRHRLGDGQATDVIGVLQAFDQETLAVRHADSTPYRIQQAAVVAAKRVPPMPLRPVDVEQLFLTTALGRPAVETQYVGQWLLRASSGWTGRGNSLLPAGDPGMPVEDALKHAEAFYTERGLPPLALVRLESPEAEELQRLGWTEARPEQADVLVMHTTLDHVNGVPAYEVVVTDKPDETWYAAAFDGPVPAAAPAVMEGAQRTAFASVSLDGKVVAVGRGSMTGHWVGVDAVRVDSAYRRRGLATAVLQGITRWAGPLGGRRSYLEVVEDNVAALTTYTNLGYALAYKYRYLTKH